MKRDCSCRPTDAPAITTPSSRRPAPDCFERDYERYVLVFALKVNAG
jgi:hypothetical protein